MSTNKLNRIFKLARCAQAPAPSSDFENNVMRAIRREPPGRGASSLLDELGYLFPRLAWLAAAVIVLCLAADFGLGSAGGPDLDDGVSQVSEHWLFTSDGL